MNNGKYAFPSSTDDWGPKGMTYREYVAAHVLAALSPGYVSDTAVEAAVTYTDKLIKRLSQ